MKIRTFFAAGLAVFAVTVSLALLTGCGGGGGSSSATPTVSGTVSGTATKGPVSGGAVTAFSISENGGKGAMIGSGSTDGQGNFAMSVGGHAGPVMLQMAGGTYMDEATGISMPMHQSDIMTCVIPSLTAGENISGIQMTPLTSMAQSMAQSMPGGMTPANISAANTAVGNYFMVNDILHTRPMDPLAQGSGSGADPGMRNYGMTIAAMSQAAKDAGMPFSSGMISAMMNDAADGFMNGMNGGSGIMMGGGMMGGAMMAPGSGTTGIGGAMMEFIQSPMNRSGLSVQDMAALIDRMNMSDGIIR